MGVLVQILVIVRIAAGLGSRVAEMHRGRLRVPWRSEAPTQRNESKSDSEYSSYSLSRPAEMAVVTIIINRMRIWTVRRLLTQKFKGRGLDRSIYAA